MSVGLAARLTSDFDDYGRLEVVGHPRLSGSDREQRWLVRSAWPSITVAEIHEMLWPWVEREPYVTQTCVECQRLLSAHADDELAARLEF